MKGKPEDKTIRGILCILTSAFFFALMSLFVKAAGSLPAIQKSVFRNFIAISVSLLAIRREHVSLKVQKEAAWPLFGRALCGTIGSFANFYIADHLLLSDGAILGKLVPFVAILLSAVFLREKVTGGQLLCLVLAFGGCLLVVQPSFGSKDPVALAVGIIGNFCVGIAYTCIRYMSRYQVSKQLIIFYYSLLSTLISLAYTAFHYQAMTLRQLLMLLLAGGCATAGQFAVTAAYSYAPARSLSVFDYSGILFSALFGFLFYSQVPDLISVCGYLLIFAAALLLLWVQRTKSQVKEKET